MLFNSFQFIVLFLPASVASYYLLRPRDHRLAFLVLVLFSMFYYAWWSLYYLGLLAASTTINFVFASGLKARPGRVLLAAAITFNLLVLAYFKYFGFILENISDLTGVFFIKPEIILPLGISFFTFQKIAYQVDMYRGRVRHHNFLNFALFVSFFPQLIAGPIVHHSEIMPQFEQKRTRPSLSANLAVGLTIFAIGLFKKVVIADHLAIYVSPVFDAAAQNQAIDFYAAWVAALGYTFQLYFDFSGYSDMAVGAARLFGIRLPINFFSPYRSANIIDFWRRWHMTLSRFLRDYLYFPLGGNRKGELRRYVNLMLTMVLGGLWHGAGWTFVCWGAAHGVYLVVNHLYRQLFRTKTQTRGWVQVTSWCVTFLAVVFAWVIFRATSIDSALSIFRGMTGLNGLSAPALWAIDDVAHHFRSILPAIQQSSAPAHAALFISAAALIAFVLPNTYELMHRYRPMLMPKYDSIDRPPIKLNWRPNIIWAVLLCAIFISAIGSVFSGESVFLYYNF